MRNIRFLLLFLLPFLVISCKSSEDTSTPAKTGVELVAIGSVKFGNVVLGEYREASIQINNYGPEITDFFPEFSIPFSVSKVTAPCNTGKIPTGSSCQVIIRFAPAVVGTFSQVFSVADKSQAISGTGLSSAADVQYSTAAWDLGSLKAGDQSYRSVTISNNGNFTVHTPVPASLDGYSLDNNECSTFIAPKKSCSLRYRIIEKVVGIHVKTLTFTAIDSSPYSITVYSTVLPGLASGSIPLLDPPASIIANGGDIKTITTAPIRDQYGNVVVTGSPVSISVDNLVLIGPSVLNTDSNGQVSFQIMSTQQRGDVTVNVLAGASGSGFLRSLKFESRQDSVG